MNITDTSEIKKSIIEAGYKAVKQLIKVAKEDIIKYDKDDELAADRLKNAAATKKLAIFDAFEILTRIENESAMLNGNTLEKKTNTPKDLQSQDQNSIYRVVKDYIPKSVLSNKTRHTHGSMGTIKSMML